jgi:xylose isomerase
MFGGNTMDKTFGLSSMEMYKAKADFAFELMHKLGIEYYCFHDIDVAPEGDTLAESENNLKEITEYLLGLQKKYGIKLL